MADLSEYRAKRDKARTPEPVPDDDPAPAHSDAHAHSESGTFVVQEHHATALHWDFRLERDGVLVSWAVPKGLPVDPKRNHLAVHTEDHPLEYAGFEGDISHGEYGGGSVSIWDAGTYICEKWTDSEVKVVLAGRRAQGRFALIRTKGRNWIMHRMDGPARPDWQAAPDRVSPMLAIPGPLPPADQDDQWAYEMKWDGLRAICAVDGGRITLTSRNDNTLTAGYPELRALGLQLGSTEALLDGEIVAFDSRGRPSFGALQQRMHVADAAKARRLAAETPVSYLIFDLLHLDGKSLLGLPYRERREVLESLGLRGPNWDVPPAFDGSGAEAVQASVDAGLEGVVAKRRAAPYRAGQRSGDWLKIKNIRAQEVVIVGWKPGNGRRAGAVGSLILAINDDDGLRYAGNVGTGFTAAMLEDLAGRLARIARATPPLTPAPPRSAVGDAQWVRPMLVGEVAFSEWTADGRLRHPSWRGLRTDKSADDVRRES